MSLRVGSYGPSIIGSSWSNGQILDATDLNTTINSVIPKLYGTFNLSYSSSTSGSQTGSYIIPASYGARGLYVHSRVYGEGNTSGGNPANTSDGLGEINFDYLHGGSVLAGEKTILLRAESHTQATVNDLTDDSVDIYAGASYYFPIDKVGSAIQINGSAIVSTGGQTGTAIVTGSVFYY